MIDPDDYDDDNDNDITPAIWLTCCLIIGTVTLAWIFYEALN